MTDLPPPIPEPPKKRRKWPWIVGGGLIVVGGIGALAEPEEEAAPEPVTTASATPAPTDPPATPAPTPAPSTIAPWVFELQAFLDESIEFSEEGQALAFDWVQLLDMYIVEPAGSATEAFLCREMASMADEIVDLWDNAPIAPAEFPPHQLWLEARDSSRIAWAALGFGARQCDAELILEATPLLDQASEDIDTWNTTVGEWADNLAGGS